MAKRRNGEGFLITTYPTGAIKEGVRVWPQVVHLQQHDRRRLKDPEISQKALQGGSIVLTHDLDSSFAARRELATELGCPADLMADSAK